MTRTKTISAVFAAVLVVLASGAAVTLAATNTGSTGTNAALQEETTTVEANETTVEADETTVAIEETTTAEPIETTEDGETPTEGDGTPTAVSEPTTEGDGLESFNVSNLTAPATANVSETITVTALIDNPNDQEDTQTVEFRLDGVVVERQEVTLEAGASENATFEVDTTGVEAGLHIHGVLTQDRGQLAQITLLEQVETPTETEETPTEVEDTPTEIEETPTEVEETPTEVEETPTEVEETPTEIEDTPTEIEETPTEVEETPTEIPETPTEVPDTPEEPERVDQLVFQIEQLEIDEWSFVIGDELEPDRTETVEDVTISDRTQRINLTALLMEDGTVEDAMANDTEYGTITPADPSEAELPEDIETVRVVLRDITIENVTFIVELPEDTELPEMPVTPEMPTEVDDTPTEVEDTPTEIEETPTEVEETPTEIEETPTEVEGTPTVIEDTPTEVEETPTEVDDTPTEVEGTPTETNETPTEVDDTPTEDVIGSGALSFNVSDLSAPETAEVGETVTVSALIENPNDQEARQEVDFRLEGDLVERQNVTIDAGESQEVTFEVDTTGLEAGTYIHGVESDEFGELAFITLEEPVTETTTEETTTETEVVQTTTEEPVVTTEDEVVTTEDEVVTTEEDEIGTTDDEVVETTTEEPVDGTEDDEVETTEEDA